MSATVSEIRADLIEWLSKDGHTKTEIESRYPDVKPYVMDNLLTDMASKKEIAIMPGSSAKKWISGREYARRKAVENMEGIE